MPDAPTLRIEELDDIDVMELEEELPAGTVETVADTSSSGGLHGELGLATVAVLLTTPAIHALAVWLAKRRSGTQDEEDLTLERRSDGTIILRMRGKRRNWSSAPPDGTIVEALRSRLEAFLGPSGP
jgi:hypothetical protein